MTDAVKLLHMESADPGALRAALTPRFRVETISIAQEAALAGLADAPAFLDVDLSDPTVVETLRRHLPRRGDFARLVVVDPGQRRERVQASIFGATSFLARPWETAAVVFEIERAMAFAKRSETAFEGGLGRGSVPRGVPGAASILAAEDVLSDLFTACLGGGEVDRRILAEAGDQITGSVAEIGFEAWMETVRRHHGGTYQHCMLVTGMAVGFGQELGMSASDVERLAQAGLAHDIGKAKVPLEILDKPGRVDDAEFAVLKMHPEWGWETLVASGGPIDPSVLDGVLHHHEALDGSGYPDGLVGRRVSDMTRVLTVCDIYGALSERRAYKPPLAPDRIIEIMYGLADQGKIEKALVRALDWVVTRRRPTGFSAPLGRLRSA